MNYALELKNVCKQYDGFALKDVNIALPQGCIMGFIGENGAGKSTTIKLIMDLIHRDSGEIKVLGKDNLTQLEEVKEQIGVVMDENCFAECLCLSDINQMLKHMYKNWQPAAFLEWGKRFGLPADKIIKDYSRGMKMKLSIAVALSHKAKLLLLDEATSGLDPVVRDEILDVFQEFIQEEDHSIFLSSHIISDLEKICDYITFIHKGRILLCQEKDEMLETYGILKCTQQEFDRLDKGMVLGYRKNAFGVEALVRKKDVKGRFIVDHAGIEDVMLFMVKSEAY